MTTETTGDLTHIALRIAIPDYLARDPRFDPDTLAEMLGRLDEMMLPMLARGAVSEDQLAARITRNWPPRDAYEATP